MNVNVKDKVVVVTGSSKGIGYHLARAFLAEQAKVILNYHKSSEVIQKLSDAALLNSKNCIIVKADVSKQENVCDLYQRTIEQFGRVDVLINNAGICADNSLQEMTEEQWDNVVNINLRGAFLCCKVFVQAMIRQKHGKIFNIASLKGQIGCANQTNYAASKAGLIGLTKSLAKELGKHNISVNAVNPGFIVTDLNREHQQKQEAAHKKSLLSLDDALPDLTNFLVFAASDRFMGVSGRVFNLDSRLD